MATARVVVSFGQSNDNGYGMSTTGLQTSYQGHDISNASDSLYTGSVKIWNRATGAFVNLSQSTYISPANGIGLGPQLYIGAHMLARWPAGDCYIIKRSYDGSGLAYGSGGGTYDWSLERYPSGSGSLLKNLLDDVKNGIDWLLANGYDTVNIEAVFMTQGEEDSTAVGYAYTYGMHLQNLIARMFERLAFADGATPYFGWVQPVIPRDTVVAGATPYIPEYGHLVREDAARVITVLKAVHGASRLDVVDTSTLYASGDIKSGDDRHWTNQGQGKKVDAMFAAYDAAVAAGYTAPTKASGWSEVTTFGAVPSVYSVTAPAASYSLGNSVTAEAAGTGFDGGDDANNLAWSCDDDSGLADTGATLSWAAQKLNGLCVRAKYTNAKNYCGEAYWWTHVLATRNLTAWGTPKHWVREGLGVVQYDTTGRIARIMQPAEANTAYAWQTMNSAGSNGQYCWAHHRGIILIRTHYARCLPWSGSAFSTTTTDQANASLTDTGSWTRVAKFRPRIASDATVTVVYGVRGTTTAGGNISVNATGAGASETNIPIVGRRGQTVLCPSSGSVDPVADAGDTVLVAFKKSGTTFSLHVWNGTGVDVYTNTYSGMTEGSPDTIGYTSSVSMDGLIMEVLGVESAVSDSDIAAKLEEMAAEVASASITGAGALVTAVATLAGTTGLAVSGAGALVTQAATLAGAAVATTAGAPSGGGVLMTDAATLSGAAHVIYNGTGALTTQAAALAGNAAPQSAFSVSAIRVPDALPEDNLTGEICFRGLRTVFDGAGFGTAQGTVLISDGTHSAYGVVYQWTDTLIEFNTTASLTGYTVMPGPVSVTIRRADGVSITISAVMGLRDSYARLVTIDQEGTDAPYWGDLAVGDPVFYAFEAQLVTDVGAGTVDPNVTYPVVLSPDRHVSIAAGTPAGVYRVPYYVYRNGAWEAAVLNYVALSAVIVMAGTSGDYTIPDYSGLTEITGWAMQEGAPDWVTVSAGGIVTASPALTQIPGQYEVTAEATEVGTGATVTQVVVVAVTANPDAATLIDIDTDRIRLRVF